MCYNQSTTIPKYVGKQRIVAKQRMPKVAKVGNIDRHGISPQQENPSERNANVNPKVFTQSTVTYMNQ